jgi:hypothetical protein
MASDKDKLQAGLRAGVYESECIGPMRLSARFYVDARTLTQTSYG